MLDESEFEAACLFERSREAHYYLSLAEEFCHLINFLYQPNYDVKKPLIQGQFSIALSELY